MWLYGYNFQNFGFIFKNIFRLFTAAICCTEAPKQEPDVIHEMALHCNIQKYKAKLAGEQCSKLFFADYIKLIKRITMRAAVFCVAPHYIDCVLISTGHKFRLNINVSFHFCKC